jgi:pimeloyl-ACP methyl ester carboxylesterase
MVLVDLRNHGNSASLPNLKPPHDIPAAARDVADLIQGEGWGSPDAMIAHSLGGKVVLEYAQKAETGSYGVLKPPKQVNIHHQNVVGI